MQDDLNRLRRDIRRLQVYAAALTVLAVIGGLTAFRGNAPTDQVLRARGLVIVDAAGRERILIGAPVPDAKNRVRTDTARVREIWGPRFPRQYLTYYQTYRNAVNGILVLDEHGFDRIAIGDSVPDPNIGRRIGPSTGVVINDAEGFERSGYSLLTVGGHDRMVLGLDDARGEEGVALMVLDSGRAGVAIQDGQNGAYLGTAPTHDPMLKNDSTFIGLMLKRGATLRKILPEAAAPR